MRKFRAAKWRVQASLYVGDRGTLREYEKYGDQLVMVRYRYNAELSRRVKTVEIIVDEGAWRPVKEGS